MTGYASERQKILDLYTRNRKVWLQVAGIFPHLPNDWQPKLDLYDGLIAELQQMTDGDYAEMRRQIETELAAKREEVTVENGGIQWTGR